MPFLLLPIVILAGAALLGLGWSASERAIHPAAGAYPWKAADYPELLAEDVLVESATGAKLGRTLLPGPDESDGHPPPRLRRQPGGDAPGREHIARGRVQRVHVRPARLRKERRRGHVRRTRAGRSPGRRRLCLVAPRCRRGAPRCVRLLDGRSDADPRGRPGTADQGPRRRLGLVRGAKLAAAEREGLVPPSTGPLQRPLAEARGDAERDRPRRHSSGRRDLAAQPATRAPRARRS